MGGTYFMAPLQMINLLCVGYINTLMLQQVIKESKGILTYWSHLGGNHTLIAELEEC